MGAIPGSNVKGQIVYLSFHCRFLFTNCRSGTTYRWPKKVLVLVGLFLVGWLDWVGFVCVCVLVWFGFLSLLGFGFVFLLFYFVWVCFVGF